MDDPGSVRSLLAQLRAQQDTPPSPPPPESTQRRTWVRDERTQHVYNPWEPAIPRQKAPSPSRDLRAMRFAEALPIVKAKASDLAFRTCAAKLREEQHALERTLAHERTELIGEDGARLHGHAGAKTQALHAQWAWDALKRWDAMQHPDALAMQRRMAHILERLMEDA
ncbi:hypothetical protein MVES1_003604 [Malassezia vespertilionis]|uniref:uncharacterized protein n=1 Tax=Malassezia vespertilionis TaxID=2020962 RepID=UPI0024B11F7A|nr:uncharacterized protein MVES1_003604 [Malassezia vespertilionis]WFD08232.1 hypothetical protein MVES1_003604 [Malassezia vespertilionis]